MSIIISSEYIFFYQPHLIQISNRCSIDMIHNHKENEEVEEDETKHD